MPEITNSQFDSFLFWRQPIPSLDLSELEDLGFIEPKRKQGMPTGRVKSVSATTWELEDEDNLSQYSTFNYWKEPIASIDALDFSLLL